MDLLLDLPTFISNCKKSSEMAFKNLTMLLTQLESEQTREQARRLAEELIQYFSKYRPNLSSPEKIDEILEKYHFTIYPLSIETEDGNKYKLNLFHTASIFLPEEWSFTFFEGISRYPHGSFQGKHLAELGCGNGWVSLLMAMKYGPEKILGMDINPRAIIVAKLNLYLNALGPDGKIITKGHKNLIEQVEFYQSDLLKACQEQERSFDCIIGCIPQVLRPDPGHTQELILGTNNEKDLDEYLYSLSNYCEKQGQLEDEFGLGLVARAVEEALQLLRPNGKMIFNMGGRPGEKIIDTLFKRRGLEIKKIWRRRIPQAQDTDIHPLVEIESYSPHRFEFFMDRSSRESICARTAHAYQIAQGTLFHSLTVYEAQTKYYGQLTELFSSLSNPIYQEAKNALDLELTDEDLLEEKISFLAPLSTFLNKNSHFPYGRTQGALNIRKKISHFLRSYHHVPTDEKNIFILPGRVQTLVMLLDFYRPQLTLMDQHLYRQLPNQYTQSNNVTSTNILEIPSQVHLIEQLIHKLSPQMVLISLAEDENKGPEQFIQILKLCQEKHIHLLVDISFSFELSSSPKTNGVFQYLAQHPLPPNTSILCGLVHNKVYKDLKLSFLISHNKVFIEQLNSLAELTYSRAPLLTQFYYQQLFHDLLKFQISRPQEIKELDQIQKSFHPDNVDGFLRPCEDALRSFDHPSIKTENFLRSSENKPADIIRMDYGENQLHGPKILHGLIMESFCRVGLDNNNADPSQELQKYLSFRFGLKKNIKGQFYYGQGVSALFAALMKKAQKEQVSLLLPQGHYGLFAACATFYGVKTEIIPTSEDEQFKLKATKLRPFLKKHERSYLFLNMPISNPSGACYQPEEVQEILQMADLHKTPVIFDTIFAGLEFGTNSTQWDFETLLSQVPSMKLSQNGSKTRTLDWVLLGGISKEFAASGLRFGFAYTRSNTFKDAFHNNYYIKPHSTVLFSAKKLYQHLRNQDKNLVSDLIEQKYTLRENARKLQECLEECKWKVITPQGGLFLTANGEKYIGETVNGEKINQSNLANLLYSNCGLLINDDIWTGIPGFFRFVYAIDQKSFDKALDKIRTFYRLTFDK